VFAFDLAPALTVPVTGRAVTIARADPAAVGAGAGAGDEAPPARALGDG
jgi:hypothetical protein